MPQDWSVDEATALQIKPQMDKVSAALERRGSVAEHVLELADADVSDTEQNGTNQMSPTLYFHRGQALLFHGVCSRCCRTGYADILVKTVKAPSRRSHC